MKICHIADLHWSINRLVEKRDSSEQLIEKLKFERPDLIVVAGDVFDRSIRMEDDAAHAVADFFWKAKKIAAVLVVRGNYQHDRDSLTILQDLGGDYQLVVSTEPQVIGFYNSENGMEVMAPEVASQLTVWPRDSCLYKAVLCTMPYPSQAFLARTMSLSPGDMKKAVSEAITSAIRVYATLTVPLEIPKILVFHGTVKGAKFSETQVEMGMDIELSPFDIGACGFTCTLAGHLHYCQKIETSSGPIFYPGGMTCLCFGDDPPKGMWVHEFRSCTGPSDLISGPAIELHSRHEALEVIPMRSLDIDFSDPFLELPAWASTDVVDLRLNVKAMDADRERLAQMDWKQLFPLARSIEVKSEFEAVTTVRCEEIRKAATLAEKVVAWDKNQVQNGGTSVATASLLKKAELLESIEPKFLLTAVKEELGL